MMNPTPNEMQAQGQRVIFALEHHHHVRGPRTDAAREKLRQVLEETEDLPPSERYAEVARALDEFDAAIEKVARML
jgi:hypothetical protein